MRSSVATGVLPSGERRAIWLSHEVLTCAKCGSEIPALERFTRWKVNDQLLQSVCLTCKPIRVPHRENPKQQRIDALLAQGKPERLSDREWLVIQHRFKHHQGLSEIGFRMGVTRERIRQIEAKAIRKWPEFRTLLEEPRLTT